MKKLRVPCFIQDLFLLKDEKDIYYFMAVGIFF